MIKLKPILYAFFMLLCSCKNRTDITDTEVREHGLTYLKGTNNPVDGEVVERYKDGKIAAVHTYKNGKAIGNWFAYDFSGNIISHGFGVDAKRYESKLKGVNLSYSLLSINVIKDFCYTTLYLDDKLLFENHTTLIKLAECIFREYSSHYNFDEVFMYDNGHEYTISKSVIGKKKIEIDTAKRTDKMVVFFK